MEIFHRFFLKKKKEKMERLSFITQFKIEFLLTFICCRKVLGKMPPQEYCPIFYEYAEICYLITKDF